MFTKLSLCSHHLKIETGRWARIDVEDRLCECGGGIQDESHVLLSCPKTEHIRAQFNVTQEEYATLGVLMDEMDVDDVVSFVYSCMKIFK